MARDFGSQPARRCRRSTLHYRTIGTPRRDASGVVRNAVLILHGTGGTRRRLPRRRPSAASCSAPGQLLDATRYFIILPDGIGHGKSSKPSDGLHARFPKYTYDDMVRAQHAMLDRRAEGESPAPRARHVDGRDALLGLGRDVSGLRRRPGAAGQRADRRSPAATASCAR